MKFGKTFLEYMQRDQKRLLEKVPNIDYNRLKNLLKTCKDLQTADDQEDCENCQKLCQDSCPECDEVFFEELMKEASNIGGCFRARVRRLVHLHIAGGLQSQEHLVPLCWCFKSNGQVMMIQEARMLTQYITTNAIALRKLLKKYDKIHGSANGKKFESRMRAEHKELLQLPWLVELASFQINCYCSGSNAEEEEEEDGSMHLSLLDIDVGRPFIKMQLGDSIHLQYDLTCAICLDTVFNPYALSCGHLFCKSCACSAASVMIFNGPKAASSKSKCPMCREVGVYRNSLHMVELNLLLKRRFSENWKERMNRQRERTEKQFKDHLKREADLRVGF